MQTGDESFVKVIKIGGQEMIIGRVPADMAEGKYRLVVRVEKVPDNTIKPEGFICGCDNKSCGCDSKETCGCNERCGADCGVDDPCPSLA